MRTGANYKSLAVAAAAAGNGAPPDDRLQAADLNDWIRVESTQLLGGRWESVMRTMQLSGDAWPLDE